MTESDQANDEPEVSPVGHAGARVEIHERRTFAVSGWLGLLAAAGLIALTVLAARSATPALAIAPAVPAFLVLTSLIIVQPGQTKVVRFFGSYIATVRRAGLWWILPLTDRRNLSIKVKERKAAMVSNLLVVLWADQPASPVGNAGTLYT
ncbi:MAG TPA: hypothetical protein VIJ83_01815 [Solirubrobacteraceae bacterium]